MREFRVLWSSVILSTAGDRLALVALTLLVFDRTGSPLLAAAVYALVRRAQIKQQKAEDEG